MHKRVIFLFTGLLLLIAAGASAQREKINMAVNASETGNFSTAVSTIKEVAMHPATKEDKDTYMAMGYIYKNHFNHLRKQYQAQGTFSEHQQELKEIRLDAFDALDKCRKYDNMLERTTEIKTYTMYLAKTFYNQGYDDFMAKKYVSAAQNYQAYIDALKNHYPDDLEKIAYFNIGYAYYKDGQYDVAKDVFMEMTIEQYETAPTYYYLGKIYEMQNDQVSALRTVENGVNKYPNDKDLLVFHANLLSKAGNTKDRLPVLRKAVEIDDSDIDAKLALATAYEKMAVLEPEQKETFLEKAKELYRNVLTKEPENFTANYNLGIIIYNTSVENINNQSYDIDIFALDNVLDETTDGFKNALPYVKKANDLQPDNRNTLLALEGIYINLNEDEKIFEVRSKLEKLDAQAAATEEEDSGKKRKRRR